EQEATGIRKQGQLWVGRMSLAPWPVALKLQEKPAYSNQKSIVLAWIAIGMVGLVVLTLLGFGAMVHRKVITRLEGFVAHSRQPPASEGIGIRWPVEGSDEIDLLAGTFNSLMERVDESERVLLHLASHDQLTELGNRRHMMKHLQEAVELQRLRPETRTCLMIADIDRFKMINDRYGHSAGDEVLAVVAERIQTLIRAEDVAARLGGDEFSVLLADAGPEHALRFCEKLNERIAQPIPYAGEFLFCTLSMGITSLDVGLDEHGALHQADQAMYQAKRRGNGRAAVFDAKSGNPPFFAHGTPVFPVD
nr:diguanylate cyclase [Arenimonas sp.]